MTEQQQPTASPAIAVSPYLSLRQAIRPLIFAHVLLAHEQDRAGQLAQDCERLLRLTREALKAAAQVHLLGPETDGTPANPENGRRSQLIGAYAEAAMAWAEIIGTAVALADALLDRNRWDDVRRLAGFLEAAGEPVAAQDLRTRADATAKRASETRLAQIHPNMTEPEILSAIEALRESEDETAASFYIRDLAHAMVNVLPSSRQEEYVYNFGEHSELVTWLVKPGDRVAIDVTTVLFTYRPNSTYTVYSSRPIEFSAIISELLVAAGRKVTGSVAIASVIRIPRRIAEELRSQNPSSRGIFERLDELARIFWQIQTENGRASADGK